MDFSLASVVPRRVNPPAAARALGTRRTAARLTPAHAQVRALGWTDSWHHAAANFPRARPAPIATRLPGGRVQGRNLPCQAPIAGPPAEAESAEDVLAGRWSQAVRAGRDSGPRFH